MEVTDTVIVHTNSYSIDDFRNEIDIYVGNIKFDEIASKKTFAGCTDITILFMWAAEDMKIAQFLNNRSFLLKAMSPGHAINAKLCSKALQMLGMKVPEMCILKNAVPNCYRNIASFHNYPHYQNTHDLTFMTCVNGANLQDTIEVGSLFKLQENCWSSVLQTFGEVAVYDLLLANHDRFYRRELTCDDVTGEVYLRPPLGADSFINPGNIMLSLDIDRQLEDIFCIDNGSCVQKKDDEEYLDSFIESFKQFSIDENREKFADIIFSGILEKIQKHKRSIEIRQEKITARLNKTFPITTKNTTNNTTNSNENRSKEDADFSSLDFFCNIDETPEEFDILTSNEIELIQNKHFILEDKQYAIQQLQIGINAAYTKILGIDCERFINTLRAYLGELYEIYPKTKNESEEFSNKILSIMEKCINIYQEKKLSSCEY